MPGAREEQLQERTALLAAPLHRRRDNSCRAQHNLRQRGPRRLYGGLLLGLHGSGQPHRHQEGRKRRPRKLRQRRGHRWRGECDRRGATAASANTIAFNLEKGVQISGSTNGNKVLRNSIFSNGSLGIDLAGDGITPNDGAGDADIGPNELQNFPRITRAKTSKTATAIRGRLDSISSETYVVRFFSNPTGGEEGMKYIGQKTVATDEYGNAIFIFKPKKKVPAGRTITATDYSGNTSEFSAPKTVVAK